MAHARQLDEFGPGNSRREVLPQAGGNGGSALPPWTTAVGTASVASRAPRGAAAMATTNWRIAPAGYQARATARDRRSRSASSGVG